MIKTISTIAKSLSTWETADPVKPHSATSYEEDSIYDLSLASNLSLN